MIISIVKAHLRKLDSPCSFQFKISDVCTTFVVILTRRQSNRHETTILMLTNGKLVLFLIPDAGNTTEMQLFTGCKINLYYCFSQVLIPSSLPKPILNQGCQKLTATFNRLTLGLLPFRPG